MKKIIYLVDISSFIFRAYYAVMALKTSKGVPTNATYGLVTMLIKLLRDKKPEYMVMLFDSPVPTFRKEIYPDYKANRPAPPEDLIPQFDDIKRFVSTYPFPHLQKDGFEADDLIATVTKKAVLDGYQVMIVSADKDLMQLVNENVSLYDSMKDKVFGPKEVEEKFGVPPEKVGDVLALWGDASDNIPGVPGVGEKTATKLIQEFGSLKNLLAHPEKVSGKLSEKIKASTEQALLSRQLVDLHDSVPVEWKWEELRLKDPHLQELNQFYHDMEFSKLVNASIELLQQDSTSAEGDQKTASAAIPKPVRQYDLVLTLEQLEQWVEHIKKAKAFAFDTETTSLRVEQARLVGVSLAVSPGRACYIPIGHSYLGCPEQLSIEQVVSKLRPIFGNPFISKYAQHAKYDREILHAVGLDVDGLAGDSLLASYLYNPESAHNLDRLAQEYLNENTIKFDEVVGRDQTFADVPLAKACDYAAEDADLTLRLIEQLHPRLHEHQLWDCYEKIELPLSEVLMEMELAGVHIDQAFLKDLGKEFLSKMQNLEAQIQQFAGREFNLNSPKQVADILFVKLALPVLKKTKTGPSTDVEVLTQLASQHDVPRLMLEYRTLSKLMSTYVEQLQKLVVPQTGRLHTSYNQTVAATGRLSSSDPNLQNIPIRTEEGRRIRQAFSAPPGRVILSADYSQIELRLLAAFSKDPQLMDAFKNGDDIHRMTAEKVFGKKPEEVTPTLRGMAKTVNFGIIYGQSAFGLATQLDIPNSEAKRMIEEFYKQFPSVLSYRESILSQVRKEGEIRTWKGRRRFISDINSRNANIRATAERTAFNTLFQGSAADLIKVAMIAIARRIKEQDLKTLMIMQVHDELVFEVPESEIDAIKKLVTTEMEQAIPCEIPLKIEIGQGPNWAMAH